MERKTLAVSGMSCDGCEQTVENALQNVEGVSRADADHEAGTVEFVVEDDASDEVIRGAVEQAGYGVEA